jgi:hypothetical protein
MTIKTNAPYRVTLVTDEGVTSTAHRTIRDAGIMIQILHAQAIKSGNRAHIELTDVREEN